MNGHYRQAKLVKLVNEHKAISTTEIIELLNVSPATARRDIAKLDEQGKIRKVRNGAESIEQYDAVFGSSSSTLSPLTLNQSAVASSSNLISHLAAIPNLNEKQRIAKAAAALCQDGESVVLTCGSTMLVLGDELCGRNLQITTNYLPLANYLIEHDHGNVVIMGGQYNKNQAITLALNSHLEYAANIMFTSCKGLTSEGLYKNDILIANSEQKMRDKMDKLVALVDSSKLGKRGGMLFSDLKNVDLVICGKEADPDIVQQLRANGLDILLV